MRVSLDQLSIALQVDVAVEGQVEALVSRAVQWGGHVDIYVNNAARFVFGAVNTVSNEGQELHTTSQTPELAAVSPLQSAVPSPFTYCLLADWDLALSVNVKGYAFGTKHASLAMSKQNEQATNNNSASQQSSANWPYAILNIASTGGVSAVANMVPYCTTKGAVIQMTKNCALDLAKHKIRWARPCCSKCKCRTTHHYQSVNSACLC